VLSDNDELCEFRRKVTEVVRDVVFIVGSAQLFSQVTAPQSNTSSAPNPAHAHCSDVRHSQTGQPAAQLGRGRGGTLLHVGCHQECRTVRPFRFRSALALHSTLLLSRSSEDEDTVSELLDSLASLPDSARLAVRLSAVRLLGQMADWFAFNANLLGKAAPCPPTHALQPASFVEKTVHFLVRQLREPPLCLASAQSIELLCTSAARSAVADYADYLLQLCSQLDELPAPGLPDEAGLALLQGTPRPNHHQRHHAPPSCTATAALVACAPSDANADKLTELCRKQSLALHKVALSSGRAGASPVHARSQVLTDGASAEKENRQRLPVVWLDRLTAIFRHLSSAPAPANGRPLVNAALVAEASRPACSVRVRDSACPCSCCPSSCRRASATRPTAVWPSTAARRCASSSAAWARARCPCSSRSSRGCEPRRALPASLTAHPSIQVFCVYQRHPHSCFLYLGSVLVDEYGQLEDFVPGLTEMLRVRASPGAPRALRNLSVVAGVRGGGVPVSGTAWRHAALARLGGRPVPAESALRAEGARRLLLLRAGPARAALRPGRPAARPPRRLRERLQVPRLRRGVCERQRPG